MFFLKKSRAKPEDQDFQRWRRSEWPEYQEWLDRNYVLDAAGWENLRRISRGWRRRPLVSIITPVFDTDPGYLMECIISVLVQSYEKWELCIVDDGSTRLETIEVLKWAAARDKRIRIKYSSENQGICHASNEALAMARGDFAVFLDHDDRLSPDALHHVALTTVINSDADVIYSDRDMISPRDKKYMHLLKPSWSPETILSGNYCFHLMAYRMKFLKSLGFLRPGFEGSQDYDLVLRASEQTDRIMHIPRVLYHWRQGERSLALDENVKDYTFLSGLKAVRESCARRALDVQIDEDTSLWRGHYRIRFSRTGEEDIMLVRPEFSRGLECFCQAVNSGIEGIQGQKRHLAVIAEELESFDDSLHELGSWLRVPGVGIVTGKIVDHDLKIVHAGLVSRYDGTVLEAYRGFDESHAGYMAATATVRNVSLPHPYCFALRSDLVEMFARNLKCGPGPWSVFELALEAFAAGNRCVYNPFARFTVKAELPQLHPHGEELDRYKMRWSARLLQGDPCYNPGLSLLRRDMSLMDSSEKEYWEKITSAAGE